MKSTRSRIHTSNVNNTKAPQNIEISSSHLGLRIFAVVILVLIAATAFGYGINALFSGTDGWQEIEADVDELSVATELTFMYDIGAGSESATTERKAIVVIYSDACETAYQLFTPDNEYEYVYNVWYINNHPNEEITVDEVLYSALETMVESGGRELYLAPVYAGYESLYFSSEDWEAKEFDPVYSDVQAEYFAKICEFASSDDGISLKLLGDNKVILYVSDEYLSYAEEYGIDRFIDFSWMTNAFVVDYISDVMIENGYTAGMIVSDDGYARNLGGCDDIFSYTLYSRQGNTVYSVADMLYDGSMSFVYAHDYAITSDDALRYYTYENGERRTPYIDPTDGLSKAATEDLVLYSADSTCVDLMLSLTRVYIADDLDESKLATLSTSGIYSIYYDGFTILHTEDEVVLSDVAEGFSVG
ncbi:MAG: hypothetical protein LUF29_00525 [Oscillospiraceae bacterium]|nr:hypothetical protein [Oscillospiraceae bacterium]